MRHNKRAIWALIVVICIFMLSTDLFGQELPKYSARVKVNVVAYEDISSRIESYIKRELRSLQDVTVVEDNANFEFSIIVLELKTISGKKTGGIALSILILSQVNVPGLVNLLKIYNVIYPEKINEAEKIISAGRELYHLSDFYLRTGSAGELEGYL